MGGFVGGFIDGADIIMFDDASASTREVAAEAPGFGAAASSVAGAVRRNGAAVANSSSFAAGSPGASEGCMTAVATTANVSSSDPFDGSNVAPKSRAAGA